MRFVVPVLGSLVTKAAGALPVPSAFSDGTDISVWRPGSNMRNTACVLYLYGTAATLTSVWLWGWRHDRWHRLGQLNGGSDIPITSATQGYAEQVDFPGIFDGLAVSATGAVAITQEFEPIEVIGI